jgi:negative regulator of genetic competence, sporulation and motility
VDFLPIGDAKLKIVLTAEDMRDYKLDTVSGENFGDSGRRGIWKIIDRARDAVGFDVGGDKILIQFYPLKDGGCEVFVTKLGILSESAARLVSRSERVTMLSKKRVFYCFDDFLNLVAACREIARRAAENLPESDAYYNGGVFYLAVSEYGVGGDFSEIFCISEFGSPTVSELEIHLAEHGKIMIKKDAVKVLSEL